MINRLLNIVFYSIFILFILYSIFLGFDFLDSGFIISLSDKINDGQIIYKDFDYVRPFGTPLFWDMILKPFYGIENHLFIICRIFVIVQFCVIAYNISRILFLTDIWNNKMFISIPLLVMLNINIFPIMPWHTLDGVFLLSFSLYYFYKKNILLAFLFSLFAASTKQSFFLIPVLVIISSIFFRNEIKFKFNLKFFLLLAASISIIIYYHIPQALFHYKSGTEGQNKYMLYQKGLKMYWDSYKYFFPFFISVLIAGILWYTKKITNLIGAILFFILICSFTIPLYHWIIDYTLKRQLVEYTVLNSVNGLLPICAVFHIIKFVRTKDIKEKYNVFRGLFAVTIVWSSSISWGANNILLALPFLLININGTVIFDKKYLVFPLCIILFVMRLLNPYMEKNFTESTFIQIEDMPVYSGIYANRNNVNLLSESKKITDKYKNVIFLPGFPAASLMFEKTKNRMPWEMNVEYVNYKKDLSLLHHKNLYFIVEKKSFSDDLLSFYGSRFTEIVKVKKKIIDSTSNFYIYK